MKKITFNSTSSIFNLCRRAQLGLVLLLLSFAGSAQVLIPYAGSNTIACGTNTVLRDHSNFVLYSNYANGYTVLDAGFGAVITINGNYITEANYDYLRIYNGVGTGGTLLFNQSGTGV